MRSKVKAKWKIWKLSRYCKDVGKTIGVNLPFYQDLNGIYCENTRVGGEGGGTQRTAWTEPSVWLISLSMNRLLNADTVELSAGRHDA